MNRSLDSLDELTKAVNLLVAHARREDAIAFVEAYVESVEERSGVLLLARLQLETGTIDAAANAVCALRRWRRFRCHRWDVETIALLRVGLKMTGWEAASVTLDREICWTALGGASFPPSALRGPHENE